MLVLNKFANNSSRLLPEHLQAFSIAATQAGGNVSALEIYGITDRKGSEAVNKVVSTQRANAALGPLKKMLGLSPLSTTFANGLGERFADEYHQRVSVGFATPPTGGGGQGAVFLSPLHMGRLRAQPRSSFA